MGFVLSPDKARQLIDKDPRNGDVVFPYLNGEDLEPRPESDPRADGSSTSSIGHWIAHQPQRTMKGRWRPIIPTAWPSLRRRSNRNDWSTAIAEAPRDRWWLYERWRRDLYRTASTLGRIIVGVRHSKYHILTLYSRSVVYSDATYTVGFSDFGHFGVFQSAIHEVWAREYSGSLETRLRYSPSDCLENISITYERG